MTYSSHFFTKNVDKKKLNSRENLDQTAFKCLKQ